MAGPCDRRQFLGTAAAAAAFLASHDLAAVAAQRPAVAPPEEPKRPRVLALELLAGAPLATLKAFYGKTLDLGVVEDRTDRLTIEAGETRLTFVTGAAAATTPPPSYHFAFNIPENKIVQALEWQKARTPLLPIPAAHRAAGLPPDVVHYPSWNAHSIFFLDPAGNVVEYIARHDLKNADTSPFSWADLLYASEVGLVVDDVPAAAGRVKTEAALAPYKDGNADLAAMGDEFGLLLLIKRGGELGLPGGSARAVQAHQAAVTLRAAKTGSYQFPDLPYRITLEERCACA